VTDRTRCGWIVDVESGTACGSSPATTHVVQISALDETARPHRMAFLVSLCDDHYVAYQADLYLIDGD